MDERKQQTLVARTALSALAQSGFALAVSGAIREHGITSRPTADVDLFTTPKDVAGFFGFDGQCRASVARCRAGSRRAVSVRPVRPLPREPCPGPVGRCRSGGGLAGQEALQLGVGPVLDLEDAVTIKVLALYGRGAARDFLDVDAIRRSGRFNDRQLLRMCADHDPGFDLPAFAQQVGSVQSVDSRHVVSYGVGPQEWAAVQSRLAEWSQQILAPQSSNRGASTKPRATGRGVNGPGIDEITAMPPPGPHGPSL